MPGEDRTGPMGAGPRTGRGMGVCAGSSSPGPMNSAPGQGRMIRRGQGMGRGFGRGRGGFGRGFGRRWWNASSGPANPESAEKKEE